jgi:polyhydroxyalkanoate synthesis regulator phasin
MSSKKMVITIAVTTAALTLGTIGIASASNSKNSFKIKSTHMTRTIADPMMGGIGHSDEDGQLASVLAALVTKGTLTQAQVDSINAALAAARTADQMQGDTRHAAHETLIATTLGISVATLESRLAAGDSLATIAGAKTGALVVALVAEATKEIDAAVTAGKITAAQATAFKAILAAQITAMVNATGGFGRGMEHMGGERGHDHGHGMGFPGGTSVSPNPQG